MADSVNSGRFLFLNPWLLHLQKMCLELKCPVCLNLLNRPLLMPCNHILCGSCIPRSTEFGSECPICRSPFVHKDLRPASHMENIVSIYRSMDEAFGANLLHWVPQSQIDLADVGRAFDQFPATFTAVIDDRSRKEPINTMRMGIFGYPPSSTSSLHSNELVHAPPHQSGDKAEKSRRPDESYVPNNGGAVTKLGQTVGEQRRFHGEGSSTTSLQIQRPRDEQLGVSRAPEEDLNGFTQISHDSPPPFGDGKDSDDDSSARGNQHNVHKFLAKSTLNEEFVDGFVKEMGQGSLTQPGEDHGRESKRMKLNYNPIDSDTDNGIHKSPFLDSENLLMSQPKHKNGLSASAVQLSVGPDCSDSKSTVICAFCQSSSLSKRTGPMIHYSNGKELVADEAAQPNIVHVHKKCIEWAPQVYFADDTVHNLEKEISRGAKLKCSHCGLKGAALGCYADSCRKSFHVPCALQIEGCRWDTENFLVLCPTHSSKKFPNEISKLGKRMRGCHASTNQINSNQSINTAGNPEGWVLCGSSLSVKEKNILAKFAKMIGATVAKVWKPNVTHVIAATDEMGACSRTVKVLMSILHGRWVLKMDWIKACLEALLPLPEEPYEVESDIHGCCHGPKKGRLRMMGKAPRLFTGLNFYFFGDFVPSYKECLEDLVLAAGGTLLKTKGMLLPQDGKQATTSTFIVYNHDAPENCTLAEEYMECRFKEAEDFAAEFGYQVLGHTWLLESIAACEIQSPIC